MPSDGPDEVDGGVGDDVGGLDEQVLGCLYRGGEADPVRINSGTGRSGVRRRDAHRLVRHKQCIDLLRDEDRVG